MAEQEQLVTLTIDGQEVRVPKGTVIWGAAQKLGIEVPIYCYHPKMDPLGACRMCFVEVEKMPKLATACTTEVAEGMVVRTDTPKVKKAREGTLEFLLINHPLDCPICDKGGECDLQDFTLRYGPGASRFDARKRHFIKPISVSENILLDRERCIACQRCVRFCQDVAQEDGLVMLERGFRTEVGVNPEAPFDSIFSGNVVEMCPVGALTAKNYRFVTRPWELRRTQTVCGLCSVGCNVRADVRVNKLLRQYSRDNDSINESWLCDRGRWNMELSDSPERLRSPLIRRQGKLEPASWDEAVSLVAKKFRGIAARDGAGAVGGIGSTHVTNEENYLFQKLFRAGFGTNNVDHHHGIFPAPRTNALPWVWTGAIEQLAKASHIFLLGTTTYTRQPVLELRIRRAIRSGTKAFILTPEEARLDRLAAETMRYAPGQTPLLARTLLRLVLDENLARGDYATQHPDAVEAAHRATATLDPVNAAKTLGVSLDALRSLAREIAEAPAATLLYDEQSTREEGGANLAADVLALALLTDAYGRPGTGAGPLFPDNNSLGARDMGVLPDSLPGYRLVSDGAARKELAAAWGAPVPTAPGLDYDRMLRGGVRALYVMGADPATYLDSRSSARLDALDFLVVQDVFLTETAKRADVVLPAVAYTEKDGTFTNTERCVQLVRRAMIPLPDAKADWEIVVAVARALGLGWAYLSPADVLREIGRVTPLYAGVSRRALGSQGARWPLIPNGGGVDGTPFLTWEQMSAGVGVAGGGEPALSRGRGE